jgi:hypothetical protein
VASSALAAARGAENARTRNNSSSPPAGCVNSAPSTVRVRRGSMTLRPGERADIITIQYMRRRATSVCPNILMQLAQDGDFLVDAECDHERTILE